MTTYRVMRCVQAVLTVNAATDGAAFSKAREELAHSLETLSSNVEIDERETKVYEHPTAPFEPYRVSIHVDVTVTLEAADEETAARRAEGRLESALADLGPEVDEWSFAGEAAVLPAD